MYKVDQCFVLDDGSVIRILSVRPSRYHQEDDLVLIETIHGRASYLQSWLHPALDCRISKSISLDQYQALRQIWLPES